jgi:radical SAM protein with 4Fe4S-binding SPASM domain
LATKREPYQKYDSFVGLRHSGPLGEVTDRVGRVRERLEQVGLSQPAKAVVRRACAELLGEPGAGAEGPRFTLHSYVVEEIAGVTDEELPRYLFYRYRYEMYPQRKILDDFPPCLQIEPTSVCNYRCVFCYQGDREFTRKTNGYMGTMSLDLFKRVIDQAAGRCEAVTLASRGEPLICPDIKDMLVYAGGKFLGLKLNTNAWYLDEARCHAILGAGLNTVVFSVDAASEPAYSQFRVGGRLDRILENIELFHDVRAKHYPHSRTIARVSGVKVPGTPELDQMERFWGKLVDQVAFVKYNPWENTYEQPVNDVVTPCSDLWRRMFVWWDGSVNPCDVDYKSALAVGNAVKEDLGELWRSDGYENLRAKHVTGERSGCFPCNRCTVV